MGTMHLAPEGGYTARALTTIYLVPPLTTLHSWNEQDSEYINKYINCF